MLVLCAHKDLLSLLSLVSPKILESVYTLAVVGGEKEINLKLTSIFPSLTKSCI